MNLPTPQTPILRVLEGGAQRAFNYRIGQGASRPLPQSLANTSLQTLSPAQLAALGVVATGTAGVGYAAYQTLATQPGGELVEGTGSEGGDYGTASVEYEIRITPNQGSQTPIAGSPTQRIFGPIVPAIDVSPNGAISYWNFSGFDSAGNPDETPGTVPSESLRWNTGDPPKGFIIYPSDDPTKTPISPNPATEPQPFPIPSVPTQPGDPYRENADADRDKLLDDVANLGDAVADVAGLAGAIADTLAENLPCNICELVADNSVWDEIGKQQLENDIAELLRRTVFTLTKSVVLDRCEETPTPVDIDGDTLQSVVDLLNASVDLTGNIGEDVCELENCDYAVPEEWKTRKAPNTPVLVLRMRESATGHTGTPKPRDISLPNFVSNQTGPFPTWTRGNYRTTIQAANGTNIVIFSDTQESGESVATTLAGLCSGFDGAETYTSFKDGRVSNEVELTPYKTLWFPNGRSAGTRPAAINNLETGKSWP